MAIQVSGKAQLGIVDPSPLSSLRRYVQDRIRARTLDLYAEALAHFDCEVIAEVLKQASGNQSQAAKILGISRVTLRTKIRDLGLSIRVDDVNL